MGGKILHGKRKGLKNLTMALKGKAGQPAQAEFAENLRASLF